MAYSSTKGFASIAYHQLLGFNSLLSGGFNIGFVNKRIDVSKLTFDNQWNGKFFDVTIPSGEQFAYNSATYLDLQAGLNYALFPSDNAYLNVGFSAMHLNRPKKLSFLIILLTRVLRQRSPFFSTVVSNLTISGSLI